MKKSTRIYLGLFGAIVLIILIGLFFMKSDGIPEGTRDSKSISIEGQFDLSNDFAIKLLASLTGSDGRKVHLRGQTRSIGNVWSDG